MLSSALFNSLSSGKPSIDILASFSSTSFFLDSHALLAISILSSELSLAHLFCIVSLLCSGVILSQICHIAFPFFSNSAFLFRAISFLCPAVLLFHMARLLLLLSASFSIDLTLLEISFLSSWVCLCQNCVSDF